MWGGDTVTIPFFLNVTLTLYGHLISYSYRYCIACQIVLGSLASLAQEARPICLLESTVGAQSTDDEGHCIRVLRGMELLQRRIRLDQLSEIPAED